jgi:hypothetical protein
MRSGAASIFLVTDHVAAPTMCDEKYRPARGKQCATVVDRLAAIRQHAGNKDAAPLSCGAVREEQ